MPDNRDKAGRFIAGKSGNPGGRTPIPKNVREMLKAATPKAAALLVTMMEDKDAPAAIRMDAAKTVLDRVYGKATQPIDGSVTGGLEVGISDADRALIDKVAQRLGVTGG